MPGVLDGGGAYSVATWVRPDELATWSQVFDFGTGTGAYMFLTPMSADHTLRYAITIGGAGAEQQINAGPPAAGAWTHLAVTYGDGVGLLYVNGKEAGRDTSMTVEPSMFADHITQNYIGRSRYADPYLAGAVDDFRVYGRTLPASEVATLAGG